MEAPCRCREIYHAHLCRGLDHIDAHLDEMPDAALLRDGSLPAIPATSVMILIHSDERIFTISSEWMRHSIHMLRIFALRRTHHRIIT